MWYLLLVQLARLTLKESSSAQKYNGKVYRAFFNALNDPGVPVLSTSPPSRVAPACFIFRCSCTVLVKWLWNRQFA